MGDTRVWLVAVVALWGCGGAASDAGATGALDAADVEGESPGVRFGDGGSLADARAGDPSDTEATPHADSGAEPDAAPADAAETPDVAAEDVSAPEDGSPLDTPSPDASAGPEDSAGPDDAGPADAGPTDAPPPVDVPSVSCAATATITAPIPGAFLFNGTSQSFSAVVDDPGGAGPLTDYVIHWTLESGQLLGVSPVSADGSSTWEGAVSVQGPRTVRAEVWHSAGVACEAGAPAAVAVRVCAQKVEEHFDAALDPNVWLVSGDAYWDSGGWLEMTGNIGDRKGAIYSTSPKATPGAVSIAFRFATGGGGDATGADGFAASFMKADSLAEMVQWIQAAQGGGGLGYGTGGPYGAFDGDAFTVEVDTWQNIKNGAEYHTDPTPLDHLELTQGLDPSNSLGFYELGDVENLEWHGVRLDITLGHIVVWYDGQVVMDKQLPNFEFRGGYIFFSGSTGYYSNYHRFDDLEILHDCEK